MSATLQNQNDERFELAIYRPHLNLYPPVLKIPPEDLQVKDRLNAS